MKFWRTEGLAGIALPDHEAWNGQTIREQVAQTVATAKRNGVDLNYEGRATLI